MWQVSSSRMKESDGELGPELEKAKIHCLLQSRNMVNAETGSQRELH